MFLQDPIQLGRAVDQSIEVSVDEFKMGAHVGIVSVHRGQAAVELKIPSLCPVQVRGKLQNFRDITSLAIVLVVYR